MNNIIINGIPVDPVANSVSDYIFVQANQPVTRAQRARRISKNGSPRVLDSDFTPLARPSSNTLSRKHTIPIFPSGLTHARSLMWGASFIRS
ncbi:hypothetical protein [Burkholderia stagnalis]|uniref:hypothetical protein n=1 Tax=Burkholderia stagnalis TaxID=1503054 RepID=UPI000F600AE6|nr:hypothetical protein [Burkholderia stagnalis]